MVIGQYSDLSEKTILVTGASSGIGKAVAIALSDQGATLVITGRNHERLEETLSRLNNQCFSITADITEPEDRNTLIEKLPSLNGICHAAGIIHPFPLRMMQANQLDKVMSVNFTSPVLITCELFKKRKIREAASLVFISSIGSTYNMKGGSIYSASKAALEAFSRSVVLEHASKRIRSNCIKPGLVRTPIYEQITQVSYNGGLKNYEPNYPLGLGEVEDIASATLFLLSDASRWIASTTLTMDGGLTAGV